MVVQNRDVICRKIPSCINPWYPNTECQTNLWWCSRHVCDSDGQSDFCSHSPVQLLSHGHTASEAVNHKHFLYQEELWKDALYFAVTLGDDGFLQILSREAYIENFDLQFFGGENKYCIYWLKCCISKTKFDLELNI